MTEGGRTVYGGGGITPDEKYETPKLDRLQVGVVPQWAVQLHARLFRHAQPPTLPKGWMPDEQSLTELHDYLQKHGTEFTEAEFTKDHDWIKRYLAKEMYTTAFNVDESDAMFARTDPEVEKAVEVDAQGAGAAGKRAAK